MWCYVKAVGGTAGIPGSARKRQKTPKGSRTISKRGVPWRYCGKGSYIGNVPMDAREGES